MTLGREVVLPMQAVIGKPQLNDDTGYGIDTDDYLSQLQTTFVKVHDVAIANLRKAAKYQKRYYDTHSRKAQMRYLEAVQLLWLHEPSRKVGVCHKLMNKRKGPPLFQEGLRKLTIFMVFLTLFVKRSVTFRALVAHFQCIRTLLETTFEQGPFRYKEVLYHINQLLRTQILFATKGL